MVYSRHFLIEFLTSMDRHFLKSQSFSELLLVLDQEKIKRTVDLVNCELFSRDTGLKT